MLKSWNIKCKFIIFSPVANLMHHPLSNLDLRGFCFCGFSIGSPHYHRKSRNAIHQFCSCISYFSVANICLPFSKPFINGGLGIQYFDYSFSFLFLIFRSIYIEDFLIFFKLYTTPIPYQLLRINKFSGTTILFTNFVLLHA